MSLTTTATQNIAVVAWIVLAGLALTHVMVGGRDR